MHGLGLVLLQKILQKWTFFLLFLVIFCENHAYPLNLFVGSSLKAPREDTGECCYWFSG